ncbi:MAG: type II secretion system F family protein, partial [Candidatus Omnitrophica bacterium]|nr:type II secretion system F family protein [Candidatus Omnitrophota bacterium]
SVLENAVLRKEILSCREKITQGESLSGTLRGSKYFPHLVVNIIAIGEETGALEGSLLRIADEYEKETQRVVSTMVKMIEPVIILIMGTVVGFIVLSMLLPIFQINLSIR